jgi:hypothetical protein
MGQPELEIFLRIPWQRDCQRCRTELYSLPDLERCDLERRDVECRGIEGPASDSESQYSIIPSHRGCRIPLDAGTLKESSASCSVSGLAGSGTGKAVSTSMGPTRSQYNSSLPWTGTEAAASFALTSFSVRGSTMRGEGSWAEGMRILLFFLGDERLLERK